jgi:exosome complex RNA-binding protein Csl4
MAALTKERDTTEIANGGKLIALPVKAATTIYQGSLVAVDANGFAIPGKKATDITAAGRAEETVKNEGADGACVVKVSRGVFVFANTSANKVTSAHMLKTCYIEDDQTVTALETGASVAGRVIRVDDRGVAVEIASGNAGI